MIPRARHLRSLVRHFLSRSRSLPVRTMGSGRRRYRGRGVVRHRTGMHGKQSASVVRHSAPSSSPSGAPTRSFLSRHSKKLKALGALGALAATGATAHRYRNAGLVGRAWELAEPILEQHLGPGLIQARDAYGRWRNRGAPIVPVEGAEVPQAGHGRRRHRSRMTNLPMAY
jgi:hypothetical protein